MPSTCSKLYSLCQKAKVPPPPEDYVDDVTWQVNPCRPEEFAEQMEHALTALKTALTRGHMVLKQVRTNGGCASRSRALGPANHSRKDGTIKIWAKQHDLHARRNPRLRALRPHIVPQRPVGTLEAVAQPLHCAQSA